MSTPKPFSILQIAAPSATGGLESVLLDLTTGLAESGASCILATVLPPGSEDHPLLQRAASLGVEIHRVIVPDRAYGQEYHQLIRLLLSRRPNVVHTHGYRSDLIGGFAAIRARIPWISTVHGFTGGDVKNRAYEWLQTRSYRRAAAVAAVSRPIRQRLISSGVPSDKVRLLPNAWTSKPLLDRSEARRRLGIVGTAPVIGWVGRLTRPKGADVLLEALARLQSVSWQASIIGSGKERDALEASAVSLGIADRVTWHGLITEASGLYSAFDAWVLSSRTEGTPIALFEAMAARVPVVATSVGGVPDVVSSVEALIVPPEDPEALAVALDSVLLDSREATSRANAAHIRLIEGFSQRDWLHQYLALYGEVARQ